MPDSLAICTMGSFFVVAGVKVGRPLEISWVRFVWASACGNGIRERLRLMPVEWIAHLHGGVLFGVNAVSSRRVYLVLRVDVG